MDVRYHQEGMKVLFQKPIELLREDLFPVYIIGTLGGSKHTVISSTVDSTEHAHIFKTLNDLVSLLTHALENAPLCAKKSKGCTLKYITNDINSNLMKSTSNNVALSQHRVSQAQECQEAQNLVEESRGSDSRSLLGGEEV